MSGKTFGIYGMGSHDLFSFLGPNYNAHIVNRKYIFAILIPFNPWDEIGRF
jgi:hypothetical protein